MHNTDTRRRFVELRAQGWSLARIAGEIGVAKRTLVDWNRAAADEIAELRAVEIEALQERVAASHELELTRLSDHLNRIEAVLARRNLDCLSTESLFCLAATVRAQLRRLAASPASIGFPANLPTADAVLELAPASQPVIEQSRGLEE
jgi:hypothetical protein